MLPEHPTLLPKHMYEGLSLVGTGRLGGAQMAEDCYYQTGFLKVGGYLALSITPQSTAGLLIS